jgi:hypothetical protein
MNYEELLKRAMEKLPKKQKIRKDLLCLKLSLNSVVIKLYSKIFWL